MTAEGARDIRVLLGTVPVRPSRDHRKFRAVQREAIEKSLSSYISLSCGHYTTHDAQLFFAVWKSGRGKLYCEECHEEVTRKRAKRYRIPDEPEF